MPSSSRTWAVVTLHCPQSWAKVFVSHSRPFFDMCHPLRHWRSSSYFHPQLFITAHLDEIYTSFKHTYVSRHDDRSTFWPCQSTNARHCLLGHIVKVRRYTVYASVRIYESHGELVTSFCSLVSLSEGVDSTAINWFWFVFDIDHSEVVYIEWPIALVSHCVASVIPS